MSWRVFKNGRPLGIVETNFPWASSWWANRCTDNVRYTLRPNNV